MKMMDESIVELKHIRAEDMPRQVLAGDSTTFNVDWKTAIENYILPDCAEVSIRASLPREEARACGCETMMEMYGTSTAAVAACATPPAPSWPSTSTTSQVRPPC